MRLIDESFLDQLDPLFTELDKLSPEEIKKRMDKLESPKKELAALAIPLIGLLAVNEEYNIRIEELERKLKITMEFVSKLGDIIVKR